MQKPRRFHKTIVLKKIINLITTKKNFLKEVLLGLNDTLRKRICKWGKTIK